MQTKSVIVVVVGLLVIVGLAWFISGSGGPGKLDVFAQCLKDKGAVFYGAFWCPHCQNQKAAFGSSAKLLPYVECSTPDGKGQLQLCTDKGVTGYPTWTFADGSRLGGEVPLETLASTTACALPQS